jgi:hypothetical protein
VPENTISSIDINIDLNTIIQDFQNKKSRLFDQVLKQFQQIEYVKEKFSIWKLQYPREYEQGYGALSLTGVFDMYVKYEMLDWNPFTVIIDLYRILQDLKK